MGRPFGRTYCCHPSAKHSLNPFVENALKVSLLENLALKPRKAFGPIRVAATGATVSPPLFESLELLGRERSLHRLRAGRDYAAAAAAHA